LITLFGLLLGNTATTGFAQTSSRMALLGARFRVLSRSTSLNEAQNTELQMLADLAHATRRRSRHPAHRGVFQPA
jgi:hypothetical protein